MDETSVSDLPPVVMSRDEARAAGLRHYYTGEACVNGHHVPRLVSTRRCPECQKIAVSKWEKDQPRCKVDGCEETSKYSSTGYCKAHQARWKRHGDPLGGCPSPGSGQEWIYKHASYEGDDCLIWPFGHGYARITFNGKIMGAHAAMCTLIHGERPSDEYVSAHSCGNGHGGCVHPRHLRWATHAENSADMQIHGTLLFGEAHPSTKLKAEDAAYIKSMRGKVSSGVLAKQFGIAKSTVKAIHRGVIWKRI